MVYCISNRFVQFVATMSSWQTGSLEPVGTTAEKVRRYPAMGAMVCIGCIGDARLMNEQFRNRKVACI